MQNREQALAGKRSLPGSAFGDHKPTPPELPAKRRSRPRGLTDAAWLELQETRAKVLKDEAGWRLQVGVLAPSDSEEESLLAPFLKPEPPQPPQPPQRRRLWRLRGVGADADWLARVEEEKEAYAAALAAHAAALAAWEAQQQDNAFMAD